MKLTNFQFKDSKVDLSKIIKLYWINNKKIIKDFKLNETKSTPLDFECDYKEKIKKQWKKLQLRAKDFFPKDSVFALYNQKNIRWEGFESDDSSLGKINISKRIDYKTVVSIRSSEDIYSQLNKEKSPKAFVLANILITNDNKLVMGKRKFYGDWEFDTYECPGAFFNEKDVKINSITVKAIVIFLVIWIGGSMISIVLDIKNGLLPSFFLGAGIVAWIYKYKLR